MASLILAFRHVISNVETFIELALRYNLSAYDAAYLALARSEKCELWTGDKALYQAVKGEPSLVKWIGDYSAA
jgi:predicted nucleic acid-binding protein